MIVKDQMDALLKLAEKIIELEKATHGIVNLSIAAFGENSDMVNVCHNIDRYVYNAYKAMDKTVEEIIKITSNEKR